MPTREAELRAALKLKTDRIEEITGTIKIEDNGGVVVEPERAADLKALLGEAQEIKGLIDAESANAEYKAWLEAPAGEGSAAVRAAAEAAGFAPTRKVRTIGEQFTESDEFKGLLASGGLTMQNSWAVKGMDLGSAWLPNGVKDIYTTIPGGAPLPVQFGETQMDPIVPRQNRTARIRDLFPVQRTNANLIDYFQVTGFTNNASVVPERTSGAFTLKPHSTLTFALAQAPVRTIAHYEVAHRNVLADEPQLQGIVNNELLYGLRLQEDYQILFGTGTGEDLLGITNTPNIQTVNGADAQFDPTTTPFKNKADLIRRAATLSALAYYEPTGVVVHPYDWESIELTKTTQNAYVLTVNVAIGADQRLWRMPVVDSPAMTQGKFLVGSFGLGAQLYDREEGNIRIAEQHSDFFLRNAVAILAEERLALAVKRPESFIYGSFRSGV